MTRRCESLAPAERRARRGRSSGLAALEGRRGSVGASGRVRGHQQVNGGRVGVMSGRGCRAAVDAGMRSPRGGRFLPRSWRGAASSRGMARRAEAGRAGAARGWAEARRARGLCWAGLRGWAESEAAAREGEKLFFIYIFKNFLKASFQILF